MIQHILRISTAAIQGETDPLKAYIELKKIDVALQESIKALKELAIDESDKYPEKSFEMDGVIVSKSRAAGRWDYSEIEQWRKGKKELESIESLAKEAYKATEKGRNVIDGDGVVVQPAGYKEGANIIVIKKKA